MIRTFRQAQPRWAFIVRESQTPDHKAEYLSLQLPNQLIAVQKECLNGSKPAVRELAQRVETLHAQIPFRTDTELAKRVYAAMLRNLTAPPPLKDSGSDVQRSPPSDGTDDGSPSKKKGLAGEEHDDKGVNIAAIVAPVVAVCVLVIACIAAAVFNKRRRRRGRRRVAHKADKQSTIDSASPGGHGPVGCGSGSPETCAPPPSTSNLQQAEDKQEVLPHVPPPADTGRSSDGTASHARNPPVVGYARVHPACHKHFVYSCHVLDHICSKSTGNHQQETCERGVSSDCLAAG